jgi:hypothetical protein
MPLAMPAMAPEKELTAAGERVVLHLAIRGNCEVYEVVVREFAERVVVVVGIVGGPWSWVSELVEDIFCMAARKATVGCAALTAAYSRRSHSMVCVVKRRPTAGMTRYVAGGGESWARRWSCSDSGYCCDGRSCRYALGVLLEQVLLREMY